jgi:putative NADH-flavin reductase
MKIALFGATGKIGSRIAAEAKHRGHRVTAVKTDILDSDGVAEAVRGHDAVVSAVGPRQNAPPTILVDAARSLLDAMRKVRVRRLIICGGAGSLEVKPGLQLVDTPDFPEAWRPIANAHRAALAIYRRVNDLDWTYISPAAFISPGERSGIFRIGGDQLLVDGKGESRISMEDFAVAVLDEIENPRNIRKRITVAY